MSELTLEILDEIIKQIPKNEILGFVISPSDYQSLKEGSKVLWGADEVKMFTILPYTGIALYVSAMVEDGKPIPLTKEMI